MDMGEYCVDCEILDNLKGTPCCNPKCSEQQGSHPNIAKEVFRNRLGPLTGRQDTFEVTKDTVNYRCEWCRRRHKIYEGNPMFGKRDKVEEAVWCWWMCVQGASITLATLHLNRSEDLVRRFFHQAMVVMAWDAEWRQVHMRFGGNPVHTTVFEVDGTRIGKFKQEEGETLYYYHHSLLGVAVR